MGIESTFAEKILETDEYPYTKSCSTIKSMNYNEQIHSCIQNYEVCPKYQTRLDNEQVND